MNNRYLFLLLSAWSVVMYAQSPFVKPQKTNVANIQERCCTACADLFDTAACVTQRIGRLQESGMKQLRSVIEGKKSWFACAAKGELEQLEKKVRMLQEHMNNMQNEIESVLNMWAHKAK